MKPSFYPSWCDQLQSCQMSISIRLVVLPQRIASSEYATRRVAQLVWKIIQRRLSSTVFSMSNSRLSILLCSTIAASGGAMAQQMYKVVGPDGKVTFSDRPALQSSGKISVMHSYTLRPYVTQRTPAEVAAAEAAKKAAAAIPAVPAEPGAEPRAQVLTPEVEDAVVTVMGQVEFARRFYNFCNSSLDGAKAFSSATQAWKKRNAGPIQHQNRLLMEVVSPGKRDELQGKVAAMLTDEGAKVAARNPKERQAWCAGVVAELNSGKADIVQPAMMAVPLVAYRAK